MQFIFKVKGNLLNVTILDIENRHMFSALDAFLKCITLKPNTKN